MKNLKHRLCLLVPMELYDVLDGELLGNDPIKVAAALRKYIILFCTVSPPEDMTIINIHENFVQATYDVFITSSSFPIIPDGGLCPTYDLRDRTTIQAFFRGLA